MNYRHGDLLIRKVEKLPKKIKKREGKDHNVLAYGEVTGHKHVICAEPKKQLEMYEDDKGNIYFGTTGATITHEEHKTITIEPGIHIVEHEREFDPFSDEIKRVVD
jgi:hypothetical protein